MGYEFVDIVTNMTRFCKDNFNDYKNCFVILQIVGGMV